MNRIWSFDNKFEFCYRIEDFDHVTTNDYMAAVDKTTLSIVDDMKAANLKTVALCLSGMDSEVILKSLSKHSVPTECFFLLIDDININDLRLVEKICQFYKTKLNVVSISSYKMMNYHIHRNFFITKVCWPTYVSVPSLIEQIPEDFYIILGEGDLEKNNDFRYEQIFNNKIKNHNDSFFYIPVSLTEISYSLSLKYFKKIGEPNFFSRSFDTWFHVLTSPLLETNRKFNYDPKIRFMAHLAKEYDLISPLKTLNYGDQELKFSIMDALYTAGLKIDHWSPFIGDLIPISNNMINNLQA